MVQSLFASSNDDFEENLQLTFYSLSSLFVRLLVSDVCRYLSERLKYGRISNRPLSVHQRHRRRQHPTLPLDDLVCLGENIKSSEKWDEHDRPNGFLRAETSSKIQE